MKNTAYFILLSTILAHGLLAQTHANSSAPQPYQLQISAGVAEKLLIHKAEIVCPRFPSSAISRYDCGKFSFFGGFCN
jgi:hypothetical protein